MAKNAEVGGNDNDTDNEIVKRSSLSKKPNILIGYLTFLCSKKEKVFPNSFWPLLKFSVKSNIEKAIKQSFCQATQGLHSHWVL